MPELAETIIQTEEMRELTLYDVMGAIESTNIRIDSVEDTTNTKIDRVLGVIETMNKRFDNIDERLGDLSSDMVVVKETVLDIQENMSALSHAVDKDAETIIDHKRRIDALEKVL
jgi:chromosome segregation ATPase